MQTSTPHISVMLNEAVQALVGPTDGTYVDATFGRGGHSRAILEKLDVNANLVVFDKDPEAIAVANQINDSRLTIYHEGFKDLDQLPANSADGILMDLGISSPQIDTPERGFSFRFNGPLDMRMDTTRGVTAAQWLENASATEMAMVIRDYGEERFANQIAKAIVARREEKGPITNTQELVEVCASAVRTREAGQSPATRTFQAIRIHINGELEELKQALNASLKVLKPGGKLVVISFHSLEDRIVKQFIAEYSKEKYDRRMPFAPVQPCQLKALGRSKPSEQEIQMNPRSRSAVLRVAERLAS